MFRVLAVGLTCHKFTKKKWLTHVMIDPNANVDYLVIPVSVAINLITLSHHLQPGGIFIRRGRVNFRLKTFIIRSNRSDTCNFC